MKEKYSSKRRELAAYGCAGLWILGWTGVNVFVLFYLGYRHWAWLWSLAVWQLLLLAAAVVLVVGVFDFVVVRLGAALIFRLWMDEPPSGDDQARESEVGGI